MQRERVPITPEGLVKLREEYDDLVNRRRPEVVRAIQQAREEGDLRENAGYDAAKHDQGFIEARIREIEQLLRRVDIISSDQAAGPRWSRGTARIDRDGRDRRRPGDIYHRWSRRGQAPGR